jgi:hypothetical protein
MELGKWSARASRPLILTRLIEVLRTPNDVHTTSGESFVNFKLSRRDKKRVSMHIK